MVINAMGKVQAKRVLRKEFQFWIDVKRRPHQDHYVWVKNCKTWRSQPGGLVWRKFSVSV